MSPCTVRYGDLDYQFGFKAMLNLHTVCLVFSLPPWWFTVVCCFLVTLKIGMSYVCKDSERHKGKGNVKFSLCSIKHHSLKIYWALETQFHNSLLRYWMDVSGYFHFHAPLLPEERAIGIHWIGEWLGHRAAVEKRNKFWPCRKSNPNSSVFQPLARHCTDWAILTLSEHLMELKGINEYRSRNL
jgi:hypothetical protein